MMEWFLKSNASATHTNVRTKSESHPVITNAWRNPQHQEKAGSDNSHADEHRYHDNRNWEQEIKIDIPYFLGYHIPEFLDCVKKLKIFWVERNARKNVSKIW